MKKNTAFSHFFWCKCENDASVNRKLSINIVCNTHVVCAKLDRYQSRLSGSIQKQHVSTCASTGGKWQSWLKRFAASQVPPAIALTYKCEC